MNGLELVLALGIIVAIVAALLASNEDGGAR